MPNIYQARAFDLAITAFIKGDTDWTVVDPITSKENARAALELVNRHLGNFPVIVLVHSQFHDDHWGGTRGVVDEADERAGNVEIIEPRDGFSNRRTVIHTDYQAFFQYFSRDMDVW